MVLFRPVSEMEYKEIEATEFKEFPACEKKRPLVTVLLSESGAVNIARHMKLSPTQGDMVYVLRFLAEDAFLGQFPIQNQEDPERRAIWLSEEDLLLLNQHLLGKISVIESFENDPSTADTFFV